MYMRMFKLQCTDTFENFRKHYLHSHASIHLFIYVVIHLVNKCLLGNYNMTGPEAIIVSKLDIVTVFWGLESSMEDTH